MLGDDGTNLAERATVSALDSIEALPRWSCQCLVDGAYYGRERADVAEKIRALRLDREDILATRIDKDSLRIHEAAVRDQAILSDKLAAMPAQQWVFAAATEFQPQGAFTPTHGQPRSIFVLRRGNESNPGAEVDAGVPGYLADSGLRFEVSDSADEGARRVALAKWLAHDDNPLTWRSIVNRVWQYHFGRGIVDSPNDFGRMGALPTHPELLDWLAVEFRDGGDWVTNPQSMKHLHRLICTSAVYRQSSHGNPLGERLDRANQYLWRMNRRKLDAESVRDSILAAAGKLDLTPGGPGFRVFGFEDDHSPHYRYAEYDPDDPASHRRSVYRFIVRSVPDPWMTVLDCADSSAIVATRSETLTALQSLALLNNQFVVRMAEHFAARVQASAPDLSAQLTTAWRIALGARRPKSNLRRW